MESFRDAFGEELVRIGEVRPDLVVLDVDVSTSTRTRMFAKKFPRRFIQLGISEQDAVSTAAGLAVAGKTPVLAGFAMFLMRAWEQIRNAISRDNLNVKIVGTHSGFSDHMDGSSHQCLEDIALMRVLPNFTVVCPADAWATRCLLNQVIERTGPCYLRLGRDNAPKIYDQEELELGKASILADGSDVSLISCGPTLEICLEAAEELRSRGFSCLVLDLHTIKPLDEHSIVQAANTNGIVVVEEHRVHGGLGSAVAEVVSERRPTRVVRIGVRDGFGRSSRRYEDLLSLHGITKENVLRAVEVLMR